MGHWDRALGPRLRACRASPRVRSSRAPIRDLLGIQAGKGVSYSPMWGLSLDFVPHVTTSGEIEWHRTAKSARFDLEYRPTEDAPLASETPEWDVSPVSTPDELQEDLSRVTRLIMAQAIPFWERVRGTEDLPTVYREQRSRQSANLPFVSLSQQALASTFVLAKSGDAAGRAELAEYIRMPDLAPDTAKRLEEDHVSVAGRAATPGNAFSSAASNVASGSCSRMASSTNSVSYTAILD
jgi:hypothetical protein